MLLASATTVRVIRRYVLQTCGALLGWIMGGCGSLCVLVLCVTIEERVWQNNNSSSSAFRLKATRAWHNENEHSSPQPTDLPACLSHGQAGNDVNCGGSPRERLRLFIRDGVLARDRALNEQALGTIYDNQAACVHIQTIRRHKLYVWAIHTYTIYTRAGVLRGGPTPPYNKRHSGTLFMCVLVLTHLTPYVLALQSSHRVTIILIVLLNAAWRACSLFSCMWLLNTFC